MQAYQKRAMDVLHWLDQLATSTNRRLNVRLVKGAYWDSEIKRAQERGLPGYPVFTRKVNTDVSYLACARALIASGPKIYPQFATHNAQTVASIIELAAEASRTFEFQRLHGMGEELYQQIVGPDKLGLPCRVYAPVGLDIGSQTVPEIAVSIAAELVAHRNLGIAGHHTRQRPELVER